MLSSLEQYFPAIRGISLFSNNKELRWSLTSASSTGLQGFNSGVQSDHYTTSFLCARVMTGCNSSPLPDVVLIQRGSISPLQLELINPRVFLHASNTHKPPENVINEGLGKVRGYRAHVRSISDTQRELLAKKGFGFWIVDSSQSSCRKPTMNCFVFNADEKSGDWRCGTYRRNQGVSLSAVG